MAGAPVCECCDSGCATIHTCHKHPEFSIGCCSVDSENGWSRPVIVDWVLASVTCCRGRSDMIDKAATEREGLFVSASPVKFLKDVEAEAKRVTWPSRKATLVTTGAVLGMATLASIFFFVVDQVIGLGVRELFGLGG